MIPVRAPLQPSNAKWVGKEWGDASSENDEDAELPRFHGSESR